MDIDELLRFGVVVVDKPQGFRSQDVTIFVRDALGCRKAGHAGTLDKDVSGVLPVGLEKSSKMLGYLGKKDKEYIGIMRFNKPLKKEEIERAFRLFSGSITQVPPPGSAVRRVRRKRKVYYLAPLEFKGNEVLFAVGCEAGTYIRTLCSDIGKGRGGARLMELRRVRVGKIGENECVPLEEIVRARLSREREGDDGMLRKVVLPIEHFVDMEKISIKDSAVQSICSGAALNAPGVLCASKKIKKGEPVALMDEGGRLIAIAKSDVDGTDICGMRKGTVARTVSVFRMPGSHNLVVRMPGKKTREHMVERPYGFK